MNGWIMEVRVGPGLVAMRNRLGSDAVLWWWQQYALPHSLSSSKNYHGHFLLCVTFSSFKTCFNWKWKQEVCLCLWFVLSSLGFQENSTSPNKHGIGDSLRDAEEVKQAWPEAGKDNRRQKEISSLPTLLKEREREQANRGGRRYKWNWSQRVSFISEDIKVY